MAFLGTTAVLSVMTAVTLTQPGKAQPSPTRVNPTEKIVFHETFDPPGDDSPDDTSGVGSRDGGRCTIDEQPIQIPMPANNFGLTFAERPSIVVRVPANSSAQRLILTVMDEQGLYFAEEDVTITEQPGLISLSLSAQAPPLIVGSNYRWHVVVVCGEQPDPDDPTLAGWVQRADATLNQPLPQKTPLEQAQWLAENGYWYDMVQVLMVEMTAHPDNPHLQDIWNSVILPHADE